MAIKFDPKLEEGIAYFEEMLKVMPDDRTTLEFLCVAYEQIGNAEKRRKALVALAGVLLKDGDAESAERIAERLMEYSEPDAQAAVLRIRASTGSMPSRPSAMATHHGADGMPEGAKQASSSEVRFALEAENQLLQNLVQHKVIDETTSKSVGAKLEELAAAHGDFLISALAVLEKENSALSETAAAYIADAAGAPPIPLDAFQVDRDTLLRLPESVVRVRGVLPFARLADTTLVVVLNPLDRELVRRVEAALDCPCRFYLASPRVVDELLERISAESAAAVDAEPERNDNPRGDRTMAEARGDA